MDDEADDQILQIIGEDAKFIPINIEDDNERMDDSEDDESDMDQFYFELAKRISI